MTMWIEIWKNGEKIVHSYKPMWEIKNEIDKLGEITNYKIIQNVISGIKNIEINNKTFKCLLTCTTEQSKSVIRMITQKNNK